MATLICPNCRSTNLRRSRAYGLTETIVEVIGRRPFRCKDCGWRGLLFSPRKAGGLVSKRKTYVFAAIFLLVVLALLAVFNFRPDVVESIVRQAIGNPK